MINEIIDPIALRHQETVAKQLLAIINNNNFSVLVTDAATVQLLDVINKIILLNPTIQTITIQKNIKGKFILKYVWKEGLIRN